MHFINVKEKTYSIEIYCLLRYNLFYFLIIKCILYVLGSMLPNYSRSYFTFGS